MGLIVFALLLLFVSALIFSIGALVILAKIFIWLCAACAIAYLIKWIFD